MNTCKYYSTRIDTILEYCRCLYKLEGCLCGGNLHILLDDGNYDPPSILFCLKECLKHPEREESDLGILICKELLKLSAEELTYFSKRWNNWDITDCLGYEDCRNCPLMASN